MCRTRPVGESSGETRRIGSISKRGSRLARYLLGQAAQASRDKKIRKFYSGLAVVEAARKQKLQRPVKLLLTVMSSS
ncbi:MAG: transposase [Chloracidobacterium sp.]|nr:transposase [Chloracidobacterium sp.]